MKSVSFVLALVRSSVIASSWQTEAAPFQAVLAVEQLPQDRSWISLCRDLEVLLTAPPEFAGVQDQPSR